MLVEQKRPGSESFIVLGDSILNKVVWQKGPVSGAKRPSWWLCRLLQLILTPRQNGQKPWGNPKLPVGL